MDDALSLLEPCRVCPRDCGANRLSGETGDCGVARYALISSAGPHFGEERVLVGKRGSGTVFFAGCNLRCVFCQNYEISQLRYGSPVSEEELALVFLEVQDWGCCNLNLVSPTHITPQVINALRMARERGFHLPVVWNSGGYEKPETLKLLEGLVDIYMPDAKYSDNAIAEELSGIENYWNFCRVALREMHRQVGDLVVEDGVARRGLLVRHLVLPGGLSGTEEVVRFLAELSPETFLNLMDQYYPCYRARARPPLDRRITHEEYREALEIARKYLRRVIGD
ncbi:MAG: radical SAM protein [candidate division WOR-3 bacterium]